VPVGVHGGGHHRGEVRDPARLAALQRERVHPHVRVGALVERPGAEGLHDLVERLRELGDLGLGDAGDPERLDQSVDPSGGHALHVALGHDLDERPLGSATRLEEPPWEVGAFAELGDGQLDRAGPGVEALSRSGAVRKPGAIQRDGSPGRKGICPSTWDECELFRWGAAMVRPG